MKRIGALYEGHRGSIFFKYLKVSKSTLKPSSALGGHGRSKYDPTMLMKLQYAENSVARNVYFSVDSTKWSYCVQKL